jgi:DNA-directed RNA polymerase subunit alpha
VTIAETVNVRELLRQETSLESEEIELLEEAISGPQLGEARQEVSSLGAEIESSPQPAAAALLRAGVSSYLLGQHEQADRMLSRIPDDPTGSYYHGLVLTAQGRHADAAHRFEAAGKSGYDPVECTLRRAGAVRSLGDLDEAESILRGISTEAAGRAEYSYQMGCILADRGETYGAIEYFERAVDMEPHHSRALFRLGAENSNRGNDEDAIRLYEQSLSKPPHYQGALLNLGLLYEDSENYSAAAYCFRRILDVDPNHGRARLYLKDIEATSDMYYDEDSARHEARMAQLLARPVTDFELSVRSRNCLQGMDINSLGDLTRISEQDLLGGKNFGETSLHEIRDVMTAHGLAIGQNLHQVKSSDFAFQQADLSPQEQATLNQPISDLNLSVRARKCTGRLGLTTVGELVQRTADELLSGRNFGVTSLNEVRAKLSEIDLKLRND